MQEAARCKAIINRLAPVYSRLSQDQIRELERAEEDLRSVQSGCNHVFEQVAGFNTVRSICSWCDKEDSGYNHFKHGKKFSGIKTDDDDGWHI
jgi:hypothetical protein